MEIRIRGQCSPNYGEMFFHACGAQIPFMRPILQDLTGCSLSKPAACARRRSTAAPPQPLLVLASAHYTNFTINGFCFWIGTEIFHELLTSLSLRAKQRNAECKVGAKIRSFHARSILVY